MHRAALFLFLIACAQTPETTPVAGVPDPFDGALIVVGGVDDAQVAAALAGVAAPLEACLRTRGSGPSLLRVAWKADGTFTSMNLDAEAAPSCVGEALESASLPLPRAGTVILEVTL